MPSQVNLNVIKGYTKFDIDITITGVSVQILHGTIEHNAAFTCETLKNVYVEHSKKTIISQSNNSEVYFIL